MRKAIVGCLILGVMACKIAWAETYVSGTITTDTIWTLAGSPYVATDTVYVTNGVKLTIEPGVTVKFATETSLICYGTLNAVGTPDGTITFTSDQITHTAGYWKGIKLSGSGVNGSQISYCDIGHAKQAVYLENVSKIVITYNYIHDNKEDDGGRAQSGGVGEGIYLSGSSYNTIGTNTISNNIGGAGGPGGSGYEWCDADDGGRGTGIYLALSTNNTISGNTISNNIGGRGEQAGNYYDSGGTSGIGCGIYLESSTNNTILRNTILNNKGGNGGRGGPGSSGGSVGGVGGGIYLSSSNDNVISENVIGSNTGGTAGGGSYGLWAQVSPPGTGGVRCGIYFQISDNNIIWKNNISDNLGGTGGDQWEAAYPNGGKGGIGAGIYFVSSNNNNCSDNSICNNQGGQGGRGGGWPG